MDRDSELITDMMAGLGLSQRVNAPTRIVGLLLDGIFSENAFLHSRTLLPLTWSSHKAVMFDLRILFESSMANTFHAPRKSRPWHKINSTSLHSILSRSMPVSKNLDLATAEYHRWIGTAVNRLPPEKVYTSRRATPSESWFSD